MISSINSTKFKSPSSTSYEIKDGVGIYRATKLQCITCMNEYENKSLEEMRFEDYSANRTECVFGGTIIKKSRFENHFDYGKESASEITPEQGWILPNSFLGQQNWFWFGHSNCIKQSCSNLSGNALNSAKQPRRRNKAQKENLNMSPPAWAYQVENFIKSPDPELICSICHNVFCDPVQTPCEHVFCRCCVTEWLSDNNNCPNCRQCTTISKLIQVIPLIKNLISNLQLHCPYSKRGCCSIFTLESCRAHLQICPYKLIRCDNKPCPEMIMRKDLEIHKRRMCAHGFLRDMTDHHKHNDIHR